MLNRIQLERYQTGRRHVGWIPFVVVPPPTPINKVLNDQIGTQSDGSLRIGYGNILKDTLSLSDAIFCLGYGNILRDTLSVSESLRLGYGLHLFDQDELFSDTLNLALGRPLVIAGESLLLIDKLRLGYGLRLSDSDNLFLDALSTFIPNQLLKTITGETLSFSDAVVQTLLAFNKLVNLGDSITLTDGSFLAILSGAIKLTLNDSANNYGDSAKVVLGRCLKLIDALPFQADFFKIQPIAAVYLHDALTLTDFFNSSRAHIARALVDVLHQVDQIYLFNPYKAPFNDTLSQSESLTPVLGLQISFGDQHVQSDGITVFHTATQIRLSFGDVLVQSESMTLREGSVVGPVDDITYMRRYLNDVEGIQGPGDPIVTTTAAPSPTRDYLRRYLNDDDVSY